MDELVVPGVDADMRDAIAIGMEKNQIAGLRVLYCPELSELSGCGVGKLDADLTKDIKHKAGTVKPPRVTSAIPVGGPEITTCDCQDFTPLACRLDRTRGGIGHLCLAGRCHATGKTHEQEQMSQTV